MRVSKCLCAAASALGAGLVCALAEAPPSGRVVLPDTVVPIHYDISFQPDSKNLTFTASAAIRVRVKAPTDSIVLNAADLVIDRAALSGASAAPTLSYDAMVQTATFSFPSRLEPGEYVLSLDYHGRIYQQAYGLFALDYATPAGTARSLFTQFENSDARRFVPCWDEPALKATFSLTATVPAGLLPVSNMPVSSTDALPGGMARIHFAETPKMSCYLLFFGVGDLERIHRDVDGTDVGVIVEQGDTASGQYALDTAANILRYYNSYFGVRYPLPKLGPDRRPRIEHLLQRHGELGGHLLLREGAPLRPEDIDRERQAPHPLGHRPRGGPPVVRGPRHHAVVGRPVAERGLRLVDAGEGDRPLPPGVERLAARAGGQERRDADR